MARKKLVFIIDDDTEIVHFARQVLEDAGFDTRTAQSTEDAVALLGGAAPDLVFCDMMMDEIDSGVTVVKKIRKKHSDVPVFLMSNIGDASARYLNIGTLGFTGFIQKPLNRDKLLETARKVFEE